MSIINLEAERIAFEHWATTGTRRGPGMHRTSPDNPSDYQDNLVAAWWEAWQASTEDLSKPIDMIIHCPACHLQHIDELDKIVIGSNVPPKPYWSNPPHKSHLCAGCGLVWRVADVCTNGVKALKTRGKNDTEAMKPMTPIGALGQLIMTEADKLESFKLMYSSKETVTTLFVNFAHRADPACFHLKGVQLYNIHGAKQLDFKVQQIPELATLFKAIGESIK